MLESLLPKVLFWIFFGVVMALFRRMAPPRLRAAEHPYTESQKPEPLPTGVIGMAMWTLAIALALTFFMFKAMNRWWASLDGPSIITEYPTPFIWGLSPFFAALGVPWPLTVWYLRRVGRWEEADMIEDDSDLSGGANNYRIMKWLSIGLVIPSALFTIPALPIHLSVSNSEIRVGHYASLRTERFPLAQVRRVTIVDGYRLNDGSFTAAKDLIIDFSDGRRLRGNQIGDGGTSIPDDLMRLLIGRTGRTPEHAMCVEDIPAVPAEK